MLSAPPIPTHSASVTALQPTKVMTVAIGLLASDGLVVAADTQITAGPWKLDQGKVSDAAHFGQDSNGVCVVTGAGDESSLRTVHHQARQLFLSDDKLVGDALREAFSAMLVKFHRRHVIPYASFPENERPSVYMLFVGERNSQHFLFRSVLAEVTDLEPYAAVGSGWFATESLLFRLYKLPVPDVTSAALLAIYTVAKVKAIDTYVGKQTEVQIITNNRSVRVPRQFTKEIEDAMNDFDEVEAEVVRHGLGISVSAPDDLHAHFVERTNVFRARLEQYVKQIRPR